MKGVIIATLASLASAKITASDLSTLPFDKADELVGCSGVRYAAFRGDANSPLGFTYFTPSGALGFSIGNLKNLDEISGVDGCAEGGLLYHIHDAWDNINGTSTTGGTNCGKANTQNHYDPGAACGKASNNQYCVNNGGCVPGSSAAGDQGYDCNPETFQENNYVCEVGDLSSKFGKAEVKYGRTSGFYSEPTTPSTYYDVLKGKSVVFHCNSGARAFCALIQ